MTRKTHDLPDSILLAYSTGQLPEAFDLVVAAHVSLSDDSRARLEAFDTIGGAVLEGIDGAAVGEDALSATLARAMCAEPGTVAPRRSVDPVLPGPVGDYIGGGLEDVRWRGIGMGVRQSILHQEDGASVRLMSIPPGAQIPDHGHRGMEMTLVLQGGFRDEFGEFWRGDVEVADEEMEHTPTVIGNVDCICLVATDSRLRFNGLLPRLAQHFLRI